MSVEHIREPLQRTLTDISAKTGLTLDAERDIRDAKSLIFVRNQPASDLLDKIARVYGGEWIVPDEASPSSYRLIRKPEVRAWANFYKRQMDEAEGFTQGKQADRVREYFQQQRRIAESKDTSSDKKTSAANDDDGPDPNDVARFLAPLSPVHVDKLAEYYAQQSHILPSARYMSYRVRFGPPPVVIPFSALPIESQERMKDIRTKRATDPLSDTDYPNYSVALTSQSPPRLDVFLVVPHPKEALPNCAGYNFLGGFNVPSIPIYGEGELLKIRDARLRQNLRRRPIPPAALLGADWTPQGTVTPFVEADKQSADSLKEMSGLPPARWRALVALAKQKQMNLVADYHTEIGKRFLSPFDKKEPTDGSPLTQLQRLAERSDCVLRLEKGYLLSRKTDWVERDLREVPWPLVENWTEEKRKYGVLFLDSLAQMCQLPGEKIDGLVGYRDEGGVDFESELATVRGIDPSHGDLMYAYLSQLPAETKNAARTKEGVALTALPVAVHQELMRRGEIVSADLNQWRFFIVKNASEIAARRDEETFLMRLPTNGEEFPLLKAEERPAKAP